MTIINTYEVNSRKRQILSKISNFQNDIIFFFSLFQKVIHTGLTGFKIYLQLKTKVHKILFHLVSIVFQNLPFRDLHLVQLNIGINMIKEAKKKHIQRKNVSFKACCSSLL